MIFILTGTVGCGKTSFLRRLLSFLNADGVEVSGFFAARVFDADTLAGYDLIEIAILRRHPFLRMTEEAGRERVGPFFVDPAGTAKAAEIIRLSPPSSLLVIDEIGPLELQDKGHWPAVAPLLDDPDRNFVFVIRDTCLVEFQNRMAGRPSKTISICATRNVGALAAEIISHGRQG
jgi:nucleoside-triphosphatase THEP1